MSERTGADVGTPMTVGAGLRRWFLRPPRPHGEVIEDRTVSFLDPPAGSVSVLLIALVAMIVALADYRRLAALYRPLAMALLFGAAAALAIGWARPAPWLLATLLDLLLIAIWSFAFVRSLRTTRDAPEPA